MIDQDNPRNNFDVLPIEERISLHLQRVGSIGVSADGMGWTRLCFSEQEEEVHRYARCVLEELGCVVTNDAFRNLYGTFASRSYDDEKLVMLGTHLDTVKNGGNFDGVVGFIVAVESVRNAKITSATIPPVTIAIFRAEESTLFKKACLGSRAAFSGLNEADLGLTFETTTGATVSLFESVAAAGGYPEQLDRPTLDATRYLGYLETHIEQARVLEQHIGLDRAENLEQPDAFVGIVTSIRAPYRCEWEITGKNTVSLFVQCVLAVEALATLVSQCSLDAVATIGRVDGFISGADKINAVPGDVSVPILSEPSASQWKKATQICHRRGSALEIIKKNSAMHIRFSGTTDHSGGTPMGLINRRDALVAACEVIGALDQSLIAPCERLTFYTDVRSNSVSTRDLVGVLIDRTFESFGVFEKTKHGSQAAAVEKVRRTERSTPVAELSPYLQGTIAAAAAEIGIDCIRLPSGAGHDAMMASNAQVPTAMMFVPSIAGLSHTPSELSRVKDIAAATCIQTRVLEMLVTR